MPDDNDEDVPEKDHNKIDLFGDNPDWEPGWVKAYRVNFMGQVCYDLVTLETTIKLHKQRKEVNFHGVKNTYLCFILHNLVFFYLWSFKILYGLAWYPMVLSGLVLSYVILYMILCCSVWSCVVLFCHVWSCLFLCGPVSSCMALYHLVWSCFILCGSLYPVGLSLVLYGCFVLFGLVLILYSCAWSCMVLYSTISSFIILLGLV